MVPSDNQRPEVSRKGTKCYVHQLLEKHCSVHGANSTPQREDDPAKVKKTDSDLESVVNGGQPREHTQSRLLTKKQLSDMAVGIRDMAKKLAHIQLKLKVKNVFILAKIHDDSLICRTRELVQWLLSNDTDKIIWIEKTLQDNEILDVQSLIKQDPAFEKRLKWWDSELCARKPHTFDIVIAVSNHHTKI